MESNAAERRLRNPPRPGVFTNRPAHGVRPEKKFKPYFTVMRGGIAFTKKALSPDARYFDFTLHESIGFYLQMSKRVDIRFGLFGDFHFSNAYITAYNPGLDNMSSELAVSYH